MIYDGLTSKNLAAIEDKEKQRFMKDLRQIYFPKKQLPHSQNPNSQDTSYLLSCIFHFLSKDSTKNHLNILDKRIIPIIITIQPNLIRINHRVIILHRYILRVAGVACLLSLGNVFSNHFIFKTILQRCWSSNARPQFQHVAVVPLLLVGFPEYRQNDLMMYTGHQALIKHQLRLCHRMMNS